MDTPASNIKLRSKFRRPFSKSGFNSLNECSRKTASLTLDAPHASHHPRATAPFNAGTSRFEFSNRRDIFTASQILKSTSTCIGTCGHARIGAVDLAMALCLGVKFLEMPLENIRIFTVRCPVLYGHPSRDGTDFAGESLNNSIRHHLRIRGGKRQPQCTVRDAYSWVCYTGLTRVLRIGNPNVESKLLDNRGSVVSATVQNNTDKNVFATKLKTPRCQAGSA